MVGPLRAVAPHSRAPAHCSLASPSTRERSQSRTACSTPRTWPSSAPAASARNSVTSSCATSSTPASRGSSTRSTQAASRSAASRPTRASRRRRPSPSWRSSAPPPPPFRRSCVNAARRASRRSPSSPPDSARPAPRERELERRVAEELARHDGLRLLGPNCLGLIVPRLGLNASFAGAMPSDGHDRIRLAIGRARDVHHRLGARRAGRLLARRLARQHARRRPRRRDRLPRPGRADALDHPLRRVGHRAAQVHVGGARVCPQQADHRLQGGALRRVGQGGRLAHGRDGGRGRRLRRCLPPRRARARTSESRTCSRPPSCSRASVRSAVGAWRSSRTRAARA